MQAEKSLQAAFHPLGKDVTPFTLGTAAATSSVLLPDTTLDEANATRRIVITNSHATNDLALFFVPRGQAPAAETPTTVGGFVVLARTSREVLITSRRRVLIACAIGTTYNGFADDL